MRDNSDCKGTKIVLTDKKCQLYLHIFILFCTFVADWFEIGSNMIYTNNQKYINMSVPIYLPSLVSVALHKGELAYCLGISQYKLKKIIEKNEKTLTRLGYAKYDKVLYPNVVSVILGKSGLHIDQEKLMECVGKNYAKV